MILVDTSAWVEFDRATRSPVDFTLTALITADGPIAVTEPIVMEVCARARTPAREAQLRRLLTRFHLARFDAAADFDAAARIYRSCRQVGVIPRGLLDCLTAAVAWRGGHELLAQDRDLTAIASVIGVPIHPAATAP